jgi:hypothetical protein
MPVLEKSFTSGRLTGGEVILVPGRVFFCNLPDDIGIMWGNFGDTKADIEEIWFDRIGQAPFTASGKFYIVLICYIRHGVQKEIGRAHV